ncbi:MAG TPA: hypothetical protein ENI11_06445 [Actinobacteria bacterium]|nr:hypothetical protein [Actinomycetota bacterium]
MDHLNIREETSQLGRAGIAYGKPGGCRYERANIVSEMPRVSLTVVPAGTGYLKPRLQTDFAFIKVAS